MWSMIWWVDQNIVGSKEYLIVHNELCFPTSKTSLNMALGDQMDDQIFDMTKMWKSGRPIWSPGAIWSSNEACFSSDLFKRPWYLPKRQQLIANLVSNLVAQERSGHPERSGRPGAIWSPIRSPDHLVIDLVLVDAFSLSIRYGYYIDVSQELSCKSAIL